MLGDPMPSTTADSHGLVRVSGTRENDVTPPPRACADVWRQDGRRARDRGGGPGCQLPLHGVDAFAYLTDVLVRVHRHPACDALGLAPKAWKQQLQHRDAAQLAAAVPA